MQSSRQLAIATTRVVKVSMILLKYMAKPSLKLAGGSKKKKTTIMKDAVEKPPSTFSCTRRSGKISDKPDQRVIFVNLLGFGSAPKLDGPDHRYQTKQRNKKKPKSVKIHNLWHLSLIHI